MVSQKFDYVSFVERTIQNLCQYQDCSTNISDMTSPERKILRTLTDSPNEVS